MTAMLIAAQNPARIFVRAIATESYLLFFCSRVATR
jgi:hypothetical protein